MKILKQIRYLIGIMFLLILFSCTEKEYVDVDIAPALEIKVIDENETVQVGAIVKLYKNEEDFSSQTNVVRNGNSDNNGIVVFEKLEEKIYYFSIEKNDLTNYYEEVTFTSPLAKNELKQIQCTIK